VKGTSKSRFLSRSNMRNTVTVTEDSLSDIISNEVFSRNVTKLFSVFQ
jgi:hypothetical protein